MKKIYKSLAITAGIGLTAITLASCGEKRNSKTPYGENDYYNSNEVIATADNGNISLSMSQYYSRLREAGSSVVTNAIKKEFYKNEYAAIMDVLTHEDLAGVSEATKDLITLKNNNGEALYSLSETTLDYTKKLNNYEYIRKVFVDGVTDSISAAIFSTTSAKTIEGYEEKTGEIARYFAKYKDNRALVGYEIDTDDFKYELPAKDDESDKITFTKFTTIVTKYEKALYSVISPQAEKLAGMIGLYKIADQEYVETYTSDDTKKKVANDHYILNPDGKDLENSYNDSFKNYGTYHAVVIQFNTRRDALAAVEALGDLTNADEATLKQKYLELYNATYAYNTASSLDDERFFYTIDDEKNDFSDLNSSITTLIQDTLEDGDALTEPRNLNNKYVMVYKIGSNFKVSDTNEKTSYKDLTEAQKKTYDVMSIFTSVEVSGASYSSTLFTNHLYDIEHDDDKANDLKIYDPVLEQRFYSTYSDEYELISKKDFNQKNIFTYGSYEYTVADFYQEASLQYGQNIITNYFQQKYCLNFADEFVDSDTMDDNKDALKNAIKTFKKNKDTTYTKDFGLNNYLLISYGYETEEDVLEYYYKAQTCIDGYKAKKVFESWANDGALSDSAKTSFLENIRVTGNKKYSELFNINLDHFLINIDANGDGSPDDPKEFLKKMDDATKTKFENAVVDLARAIYIEAMDANKAYGENSYYDKLVYIKKAYEEGQPLKNGPFTSISGASYTTWDDFKEFGFLITVEKLASNGDITQDSVSNFVVPFKEYVENVYQEISKQKVDLDDEDTSVFYLYNKTTETGSQLDDVSKSNEITMDTLCQTSFGYHVLLVNDYEGPDSCKYSSTDENDYQANLSILIKKDEDDSSKNISIKMNSFNTESDDAASFNQFFIYYVQKANGVSSSLDSDISSLMGSLFSDVYSMYTSSNFQTYLLLKKLNITYKDNAVKGFNGVAEAYYGNLVTGYGEDEEYIPWITSYSWDRPEK